MIREPGVFANHMSREGMTASLRYLRLPVLFVTMMRHPAERCLSQFYHFTISMHGLTVKGNGTRDKLGALRGCRDEQFKYMRAAATDSIEKVWGAYAFIGVTHRYPESALMLARACGGTDADALYLDAKVADGRPAYFSSHHYNFSRHLPLSDEPREVQAYAMSDDFRRANSRDLALLQSARRRASNAGCRCPTMRRHCARFRRCMRALWPSATRATFAAPRRLTEDESCTARLRAGGSTRGALARTHAVCGAITAADTNAWIALRRKWPAAEALGEISCKLAN